MRARLFRERVGGPVGDLEEQREILGGLQIGDTEVEFRLVPNGGTWREFLVELVFVLQLRQQVGRLIGSGRFIGIAKGSDVKETEAGSLKVRLLRALQIYCLGRHVIHCQFADEGSGRSYRFGIFAARDLVDDVFYVIYQGLLKLSLAEIVGQLQPDETLP